MVRLRNFSLVDCIRHIFGCGRCDKVLSRECCIESTTPTHTHIHLNIKPRSILRKSYSNICGEIHMCECVRSFRVYSIKPKSEQVKMHMYVKVYVYVIY